MMRTLTVALALGAASLFGACSGDAEKSPPVTEVTAAAEETPEAPAAKPSVTYYTIPG